MNFTVIFYSVIKRMLLPGRFRSMPIVYEGVEYCNFIKWYRDNKKRLREFEMEEIRLSPLTVTGIPKSDSSLS